MAHNFMAMDNADFRKPYVPPAEHVEEEVSLAESLGLSVASLAALSLPSGPNPTFSPLDVVEIVCRGLQMMHVPRPNEGAMRLHQFATCECRATLTGRPEHLYDGPETFVHEALLWGLPGCDQFAFIDSSPEIPATATRGAMATVTVQCVENVGYRFRSGFPRHAGEPYEPEHPEYEAGRAEASPSPVESYARVPEPVSMSHAASTDDQQRAVLYKFTLAQERRPPLTGCWMIQSIVNLDHNNDLDVTEYRSL